ncbi:MAG: hypothetical protein JNM38_20925 [Acidobacteria bacterium]|jgi:hypothetical protein|nr:hypothetical protein [Acidobacteriota bacterium]
MLTEMIVALREALGELAAAVTTFVPRLGVAVGIVVLGWVIARAAAWVVRQGLSLVPVDRLSERVALAEALRLAELPPTSRLLAGATFWCAWLTFVAQAVETMQLPGLEHARADLFAFLVQIARASLIVVIGVFASHVLWKATLLAAFNAGLPSARLMATALRVVVIAITVLTALAQVGVPLVIVLTAFSIAFGALMLGLALAFGLGGRDAARDAIAQHTRGPATTAADAQQHL